MESIIIILFFVLLGFGYLALLNLDKKKEKSLQKKIKKIHSFNATQQITNYNASQGISVDERRQKISLIENGNNIKIYKFKEILEVELLENKKSLLKTSSGSMIGRALVGGVALGGIGALAGGITGTKVQEEKITEVSLKIILNSISNSIFIYTLLKEDAGIDKNSQKYKQAISEARKWYGIIKVIIKQSEENEPQLQPLKESFDTPFGTNKIKYLEDTIGTEERYFHTANNHNFTKEGKNILIEASVDLKKDKVNQTLIDRAYRILSKYQSKEPSPIVDNHQAETTHSKGADNQDSKYFSVADEILKLKTLRDDSIITEEDFSIQKNKLLNQ